MKKTLILLLAVVLPLAAHADRDIDRTVPAAGVKEVRVSNTAGSLEITGSDRDDIRVTGRVEDDVEEVLIEQDGSVLVIEVKMDRKMRGRVEGSAYLEIAMPEGLRLSAVGTSSGIEVEGVRGEQRLKSVSGDVRTQVWGESVSAETVSGDVRVQGHDQPARARLAAVSGDVEVESLAGELDAKSVSGDLVVSDSTLSRARFETTSGDLVADVVLERDGRFEAESVSGDIELELGGEVDARIEVSSFSGRIENCFGPEPERKSRYAPGSELRFTRGEGNGDVRLQTLSGDIDLCTR